MCSRKKVFLNFACISQYKQRKVPKSKSKQTMQRGDRNLGDSEENRFLRTKNLKCKRVNTVKGQMQSVLKG